MKRPRILVTCDRAIVGDPARLSDLVNSAYVRSVERAGGFPLLLPALSARCMEEALSAVDGILLTGGRDYRAAGRHPTVDLCEAGRERRDLALWPVIAQAHHAVLGICLGMQLMNLGAGGTLYQDIESQNAKARLHRGIRHLVRLKPGSRVERLLGGSIRVLSNHHQAIRRLAAGFVAVGWASDGVIETMEVAGNRFMVGVQWHPERMGSSRAQSRLFDAFVRAAGNGGCWE